MKELSKYLVWGWETPHYSFVYFEKLKMAAYRVNRGFDLLLCGIFPPKPMFSLGQTKK